MRVRIDPGTQRMATGLIVLVGGALVLTLSACGLFDIRPPVPPGTVKESCQGDSPTSSDIVITNFALAVDCRKDGSGLFAQSITDGFSLVLDARDYFELQQFGVTRDSINRAETILAQERIATSTEFPDSFRFVFTPVVPQDQGGSQVYYELMPYRLEMYQLQGDTAQLATQYAGVVNLTVSEEQAGTWAISRWVDFRDNSGNRSLGYLYALKALTPG
jgi:hypothetical protein